MNQIHSYIDKSRQETRQHGTKVHYERLVTRYPTRSTAERVGGYLKRIAHAN